MNVSEVELTFGTDTDNSAAYWKSIWMAYLFMWLGCWSNPVMITQLSFCVYLYLFYAIGDHNVRWMYIYNCYIVSLDYPLVNDILDFL